MKRLLSLLLICLSLGAPVYAESPDLHETVYYKPKKALSKLFPSNSTFKKETLTLSKLQKKHIEKALGWKLSTNTFTYYNVNKNNNSEGTAFLVNEMGKHYPITYMIKVTPEHKIGNLVVMVYRERIGTNIRKNRFLRQFRNKNLSNPIEVDNDITGISGATISSWATAAAVKKALVLAETLSKKLQS
jgi:Na+-translocating ferredoxin:NAD+ oxidoreductase RnfG subunit